MTKVLRKYRNWFIALFGTFLMVSFLLTGPTSMFQPDPLKQVEGTLGSTKVRVQDTIKAAGELEALKTLAPQLVEDNLNIQDPMHWLMLSHEAQSMGLVGNEQDGRESLSEIAQQTVPLLVRDDVVQELRETQPQMFDLVRRNPQFLDMFVQQRMQQLTRADFDARASQYNRLLLDARPRVASSSRLTEAELDKALAKLRGVLRMQNSYLAAARLSEQRFVQSARQSMDRVLADALVIPGITHSDPAFTPTDAQISEQFEKFKAVNRSTSETGFGYQQPPRVKLEWITFSRDAIASSLTLDLKDISKHWQQNRSRFPGELDAERVSVEADLKDARVSDVLSEVDRAWKARVRSDTRRFPIIQGVKTLPADWASTRPPLASLAQSVVDAVQATLKTTIPAPTVQSQTTRWVLLSSAQALPGIGQAEFASGSRRFSLPQVLASTYELSDDSSLGVQVGLPLENALTDDAGNRHYLVVTDVRKSSAPDTIDEVRDQVIRDLREINGFERLQNKLSEYMATAAASGLDAVATAVNATITDASITRVTVSRRVSVTQDGAAGLPLVKSDAVRDEILRTAQALGTLTPATAENQALRTGAAVSVVDRAGVVVQVTGTAPLTQETLRRQGLRDAMSLSVRDLSRAGTSADAADAFSPEAVQQRLKWKPTVAPKPKTADAPAPDASPAPTSPTPTPPQ